MDIITNAHDLPQVLSSNLTDKSGLLLDAETPDSQCFDKCSHNGVTSAFKFCYALSPLYRIPVEICKLDAHKR